MPWETGRDSHLTLGSHLGNSKGRQFGDRRGPTLNDSNCLSRNDNRPAVCVAVGRVSSVTAGPPAPGGFPAWHTAAQVNRGSKTKSSCMMDMIRHDGHVLITIKSGAGNSGTIGEVLNDSKTGVTARRLDSGIPGVGVFKFLLPKFNGSWPGGIRTESGDTSQ
eukprot:763260-Hanusia_phi.AAC.2